MFMDFSLNVFMFMSLNWRGEATVVSRRTSGHKKRRLLIHANIQMHLTIFFAMTMS